MNYVSNGMSNEEFAKDRSLNCDYGMWEPMPPCDDEIEFQLKLELDKKNWPSDEEYSINEYELPF